MGPQKRCEDTPETTVSDNTDRIKLIRSNELSFSMVQSSATTPTGRTAAQMSMTTQRAFTFFTTASKRTALARHAPARIDSAVDPDHHRDAPRDHGHPRPL